MPSYLFSYLERTPRTLLDGSGPAEAGRMAGKTERELTAKYSLTSKKLAVRECRTRCFEVSLDCAMRYLLKRATVQLVAYTTSSFFPLYSKSDSPATSRHLQQLERNRRKRKLPASSPYI